MRDHRKLKVFHKADALVLRVFEWTAALPSEERFVLRSQLRRSALSIATNIVEGSARVGEREYVNFLNMAAGSSAELGYLLSVAARLYPRAATNGSDLPAAADEVTRMLVGLIESLRPSEHSSPNNSNS